MSLVGTQAFVFGIRAGGDWKFYVQRQALVEYYHRTTSVKSHIKSAITARERPLYTRHARLVRMSCSSGRPARSRPPPPPIQRCPRDARRPPGRASSPASSIACSTRSRRGTPSSRATPSRGVPRRAPRPRGPPEHPPPLPQLPRGVPETRASVVTYGCPTSPPSNRSRRTSARPSAGSSSAPSTSSSRASRT
jgi:hypothetical protein